MRFSRVFSQKRKGFVYFRQFFRRCAEALLRIAQRLNCCRHIGNRRDAVFPYMGKDRVESGFKKVAGIRDQEIECLRLLFKAYTQVIKAGCGQGERAEGHNGNGGPQSSGALAEPPNQCRDSGANAEKICQITDEFMVIAEETIQALLKKIHGGPPVQSSQLKQ